MNEAPDFAADVQAPRLTAQGDALLENPFWHALGTEHAGIAQASYLARRYPAEVIPFAALASRDQAAFAELRELLTLGESIYLTGDSPPAHPGLLHELTLPGLQMIYAPSAPVHGGVSQGATADPPAASGHSPAHRPALESAMGSEPWPAIELLGEADTPAMLELKRVAFPGYFGPRAPSLGVFYGIRVAGELVAMAGERLALPGMREVSAVCTHPDHAGRGYSARLVRAVVEHQLRRGALPFLQVASNNARAIALYRRCGFVPHREILFHRLQRVAEQ